ncbi:oncostatin-M-specific receptor subunit beta isoform X2 [Ambystoma mexicanum]|uniref:oncostatin-M-specific receptor subunit beta isoform X2 n=1 Tax=Ambystoma mexicanum TaxID=8296 RepID=UPI0037E7068E
MELFADLKTILVLVMAANLNLQQCSGSVLFPPFDIRLNKDSWHQRLFLEWNVSREAYVHELNMLFQIEVSRSEMMTLTWKGNYSTRLTEGHAPLNWSWDSDLPLECVSHSIRLRSTVDDARFPYSSSWSEWSPWQTVQGWDPSDRKLQVFPNDKTVEKGSNVTFCCIAGKGQRVLGMTYSHVSYPLLNINNRSALITVKNVPLSRPNGANIFCILSDGVFRGTVLFVSKPPDQPKSLSCETRDLKVLICSWLAGEPSNLSGNRSTAYRLSEWNSQNTTTCSNNEWCSWPIHKEQKIYNFTLTAENGLGKRYAHIIMNVAHKVQPLTPIALAEHSRSPTSILLYWSMRADYTDLQLACQIEVHKDIDGKTSLYNITTSGLAPNELYTTDIKRLHPYTNYTMRIRCGTAAQFWKWSDWSEKLSLRTGEAAPTVSPDIWREVHRVSDGRKVILHWRPLPDFQANGELISYKLDWEPLNASARPQHRSIPATSNHTEIFIGTLPYRLRVTAWNSVGSSLPAEMRIAGVEPEEHGAEDMKEERVSGTGDGIKMSWQPDPFAIKGYIVDWCNYPRTSYCGFQWKKYPPGTFRDVIKSDSFQPGIRYRFRVHAAYEDGARLMEIKTGYTKEIDGSTACRFTIGNPEAQNFTAKRLKPNTPYSLALVAVTAGGESAIDFFTDADTLFDSQAILLAFILPVVLSSVMAVTLLGLAFWKRNWLKEALYPEIPDPKKSNAVIPNTFKGSSGRAVLNLEDCIPQTLEVVEKADEEKCQPMDGNSWFQSEINNDLLLGGNVNIDAFIVSTNPYYLSLEKWNMEFGPTPPVRDSKCNFDNLSYSSEHQVNPACIPFEQMSSAIYYPESRPGMFYQPQTQVQPYSGLAALSGGPASATNQARIGKESEYLTQTEVPSSEFRSSELTNSSEYRALPDFNEGPVNAVTSQYSSGDVSPTSTHSEVFLL